MNVRGLLDWLVGHFRLSMIVIWSAIIVCLGLSLAVKLFANQEVRATVINITVAPSHAIIKLDGEVKRNGSYIVEPGSHRVEASAEGFKSKSYDVTVDLNSSQEVSFYLENTTVGMEFYEKSEVEINLLRTIAKSDESAEAFLETYDSKRALISETPFVVEYLTTRGYQNNMRFTNANSDKRCKGTLCILVSGFKEDDSSFYNTVKKTISDRGYNIEDYEVFYEFR